MIHTDAWNTPRSSDFEYLNMVLFSRFFLR